MEKATRGCLTRHPASIGYCLAVALGCCGLPVAGQAQDASPAVEMVTEANRADPGVRMELSTTALPRFDSTETGAQAARIEFSLLTPGGTGVGPLLGMTGLATPTGLQPSWVAATRPGMDLGLHLRHTTDGNRQFDL